MKEEMKEKGKNEISVYNRPVAMFLKGKGA